MIVCSKITSMVEGDEDRRQMVLGDDGQILGQLGDPGVAKKAELELNDKIEALVAEKDTPFADAFKAVLGDPSNAGLKQAYAGFTADRYAMERAQPDADMTSLDAGVEIDSRAKAYSFEHPTVTYRDAVGFVLKADPELKATYEQAA